jgi:hypothetical protein
MKVSVVSKEDVNSEESSRASRITGETFACSRQKFTKL